MTTKRSPLSVIVLALMALARSANAQKHANLRRLKLLDPKTVQKKPRSSTKSCPKLDVPTLRASDILKSQGGEDAYLLENWFNGLCEGTYIEMGALDGVHFSNTYVLNKSFGWKGVMIELSPKSYSKLIKNRPDEIANVNAAVCSTEQTLHFVEGKNAVSGVWEFASDEYRQNWWSDITLDQTQPVQCQPMKDILESTVGEGFHFDFFSLDVEGSELEVVKSIDFQKVSFGVMVVEALWNKDANEQVKSLFLSNGYKIVKDTRRSMWFVNQHFDDIYGLAYGTDIGRE